MPAGILNPKDDANSTSARPAHANTGAGVRKWFTGAGPGTELNAEDLNAFAAQLRALGD